MITMPVIVGTLGRVKKKTYEHVNKIPGSFSLYEIWKIVLCRTVHFLRKESSIWMKKINIKSGWKKIRMHRIITFPRARSWVKACGRIKRLINDISHEKTRTFLRKGNFKRKTESPQIAAQNNAISTNDIKTRIDKTKQNNKRRLYGDRDETINHIISKSSK